MKTELSLSQCVYLCAFGLYCLNVLVGIIAQLRLYHFGKAHHVLYFIVFATAFAATIVAFHPALLLTLAALATMPKSRPWTWKHPVCAMCGLLGYILSLLQM
jgi:hypothetical protein